MRAKPRPVTCHKCFAILPCRYACFLYSPVPCGRVVNNDVCTEPWRGKTSMMRARTGPPWQSGMGLSRRAHPRSHLPCMLARPLNLSLHQSLVRLARFLMAVPQEFHRHYASEAYDKFIAREASMYLRHLSGAVNVASGYQTTRAGEAILRVGSRPPSTRTNARPEARIGAVRPIPVHADFLLTHSYMNVRVC